MKNSHVGLAAAGGMVLILLPWVVAQTSSGRSALTEKESSAAMSTTTQQDSPPRKVIVGSLMYAMYRDYPGLEKRLQTLSAFIDDMARQSQQKYGAGLDLVALPEFAVNGGREGSAAEIAEPAAGTGAGHPGRRSKKAQDLRRCAPVPGRGRRQEEALQRVRPAGPAGQGSRHLPQGAPGRRRCECPGRRRAAGEGFPCVPVRLREGWHSDML